MLLEKLLAIQSRLEESDTAFATRLGVSYSLWRSVRARDRGIGKAMLSGIIRAFPELNRDVIIALAEYRTIDAYLEENREEIAI